jgi:hypothetical protein
MRIAVNGRVSHESQLSRTSGTLSNGRAGTRDAADPLMAHELPKRHTPWTIHDPPPEPPVPINDPDPADTPDEHPSEDGTESSSEAPISAGSKSPPGYRASAGK